jgi:DNA-directed RNA polymerase III subunit RPC3
VASDVGDFADDSGGIARVDPGKIDLDRSLHRKRKRRRSDPDEAEVDGAASPDETDEGLNANGHGTGLNDEDQEMVNGGASDHDDIKSEEDASDEPDILTGDQLRRHLTRQNLLLLAEHPYAFVTYHRRRPPFPERWSVDFVSLSRRLRLLALENILTARYGQESLRLVRILREKGKLDEKSLGSLSLMNQKLMRSILNRMHEAGHLELQEVPRDNQRAASRTIFLWFFDEERCIGKILQETYKSMSRCLQRIKVEAGAVSVTLGKASRTDIAGKEKEYLSKREIGQLEQWRAKEEQLLGQLGRLDDLVAVLRDF